MAMTRSELESIQKARHSYPAKVPIDDCMCASCQQARMVRRVADISFVDMKRKLNADAVIPASTRIEGVPGWKSLAERQLEAVQPRDYASAPPDPPTMHDAIFGSRFWKEALLGSSLALVFASGAIALGFAIGYLLT